MSRQHSAKPSPNTNNGLSVKTQTQIYPKCVWLIGRCGSTKNLGYFSNLSKKKCPVKVSKWYCLSILIIFLHLFKILTPHRRVSNSWLYFMIIKSWWKGPKIMVTFFLHYLGEFILPRITKPNFKQHHEFETLLIKAFKIVTR